MKPLHLLQHCALLSHTAEFFRNTYKDTQMISSLQLGCPGLPWWSSGWESACQSRGHGFDTWYGKIPHAPGQLDLWHNYWAQALACAPQQQRPPQWETRAPQLEREPVFIVKVQRSQNTHTHKLDCPSKKRRQSKSEMTFFQNGAVISFYIFDANRNIWKMFQP